VPLARICTGAVSDSRPYVTHGQAGPTRSEWMMQWAMTRTTWDWGLEETVAGYRRPSRKELANLYEGSSHFAHRTGRSGFLSLIRCS
jgi:hypothetical protein